MNMALSRICCNCKHLCSYVESVGPGEGIIKHVCKIDKKEVKYAAACSNGKFDIKIK